MTKCIHKIMRKYHKYYKNNISLFYALLRLLGEKNIEIIEQDKRKI